jgi:hypothetical protein
MFLIASSSVLCASLTIVLAIARLVDGQHRIRPDHLARGPTWNIWLLQSVQNGFRKVWIGLKGCVKRDQGVKL